MSSFEVYDAAARRWRSLAPLPGARGGTGAAALGARIVSVGGEEPAGTIPSVYAYDVGTRRWSRLADLPTPRHGLGGVAAGGRIWGVAGGRARAHRQRRRRILGAVGSPRNWVLLADGRIRGGFT